MALMTGEQYVESMRKLNLQVYMFGEKIENPVDDPILRPSLNSVKMTYDLAQMPEYEDLMTSNQPLYQHPHERPGSRQESKNAAALRSEDSGLLPALCRNGRFQRRLQHLL